MSSTAENRAPYGHKFHRRLVHSGWAPSTEDSLHKFIKREIHRAKRSRQVYLPVIQEFKDLIESDANIYMNFIQMFKEVLQPAKVLSVT